jgi:hypothetical protein
VAGAHYDQAEFICNAGRFCGEMRGTTRDRANERVFQMVDSFASADLPADVIGFKYPLPCLAKAIGTGGPIKIVAMGSSSTAGRADVLPYPYWLEMYLRRDAAPNGNARIDVINRGRGGEEADKELDRFQPDVFALEPVLVIWQVGTNAVFHREDYDIDVVA